MMSCRSGDGVSQLLEALGEQVKIQLAFGSAEVEECIGKTAAAEAGDAPEQQPAIITRARQRERLLECQAALLMCRSQLGDDVGIDGDDGGNDVALDIVIAAEELRVAVQALGRILGQVDVEDLLDVIFRDFCIGK